MMKLHPQSHVTLKFRGHLTNEKSYISTFTSPMAPKLSKWKLRMKRPHKEFCLKIRLRGHVMNQKRYISTFTRPKGHQNE